MQAAPWAEGLLVVLGWERPWEKDWSWLDVVCIERMGRTSEFGDYRPPHGLRGARHDADESILSSLSDRLQLAPPLPKASITTHQFPITPIRARMLRITRCSLLRHVVILYSIHLNARCKEGNLTLLSSKRATLKFENIKEKRKDPASSQQKGSHVCLFV
jgi:hypothetical protein